MSNMLVILGEKTSAFLKEMQNDLGTHQAKMPDILKQLKKYYESPSNYKLLSNVAVDLFLPFESVEEFLAQFLITLTVGYLLSFTVVLLATVAIYCLCMAVHDIIKAEKEKHPKNLQQALSNVDGIKQVASDLASDILTNSKAIRETQYSAIFGTAAVAASMMETYVMWGLWISMAARIAGTMYYSAPKVCSFFQHGSVSTPEHLPEKTNSLNP